MKNALLILFFAFCFFYAKTENDSLRFSVKQTGLFSHTPWVIDARVLSDLTLNTSQDFLTVYDSSALVWKKVKVNTFITAANSGTLWQLGGQNTTANANIGTNDAFRFGISTNGTARQYFSSDGRIFSSTVTDWLMTPTDSFELRVGSNGWLGSTAFSRLIANGLVSLQANHSTGAVAMVLPDNTETAMSIAISGGNNFLLFNSTDGAEKLTVGSSSAGATVDISGSTKFDNRTQLLQGADVASASTIALSSGNSFELTGTTPVTLITSTGWQEGSQITLIANGNVTITNGTATSGSDVTIKLAGASNFAMTADDTLTLILSSTTAGGVAWREVFRSAN